MTQPRLDLWLHAARFFKTRALAATAVEAGRVELNGQKTKRGKLLRPGDQLSIRIGPYEYRVTVLELARRRGPARLAAALYREEAASRAARERLAEQHRLAAKLSGTPAKGRPTKRERRELEKLQQRDQ
ncbi:MAG TPA: RNA-binding S4 domain-containing protein [Gemmatimonadales bacterium]|jgi:ribosome-associated heat shock protein Hsp15|nr:RNA-binding S4 domain-containing protein [Gemmatimonadales bacterium]